MSDFTPRAQQVLDLARKEADGLNHNYVGSEHLLLGLVKLGEGGAVNVLQKKGLHLETIRLQIEKLLGGGGEMKEAGNISYIARAKKVLALAGKEATSLSHLSVGTEHILLGLLCVGEGLAVRALKILGVNIDRTRNEMRKDLDSNSTPGVKNNAPREPTRRAQRALVLARMEADRFNHTYVGTAHLLLGLIKLGQGVAIDVLREMAIDLETVRRAVEKQAGRGAKPKAGKLPYTPRVEKVLSLADKEAKSLRHSYVGTEHILLGILREGDGVAARMLKNLGMEIERTRNEILNNSIRTSRPAQKTGFVSSRKREVGSTNGGCRGSGEERQIFARLRHNFVHPGQECATSKNNFSRSFILDQKENFRALLGLSPLGRAYKAGNTGKNRVFLLSNSLSHLARRKY